MQAAAAAGLQVQRRAGRQLRQRHALLRRLLAQVLHSAAGGARLGVSANAPSNACMRRLAVLLTPLGCASPRQTELKGSTASGNQGHSGMSGPGGWGSRPTWPVELSAWSMCRHTGHSLASPAQNSCSTAGPAGSACAHNKSGLKSLRPAWKGWI